jgi:hypothetical protein
MLIRFIPRSGKIDFQHVLARVADLDTVGWDGTAENDGKEIVFDVSLLQIGHVEALHVVSNAFQNWTQVHGAYRKCQGP